MIRTTALLSGHYECRSFEETIPILKEFCALEVVGKPGNEVTMKHPNTDWLLVVHEGGPTAKDKPLRNHYGVRVATNKEIDEADAYLESKKEKYRVEIMKPRNHHLARSVHFFEPGGNWWEIESYELGVKVGMGANVAIPWKEPLSPEKFPGRGYIPHALTHGTIESDNLEVSRRFYQEVLGLDVVSPSPSVKPHYIKHRSTPWYIVSLEVPKGERSILGRFQRFTIGVESPAAVEDAFRWLREKREDLGITELEEIGQTSGAVSFLFSDPDQNWWEVSSAVNQG